MAETTEQTTTSDQDPTAAGTDEDALYPILKGWVKEGQQHLSKWREEAKEAFGFVAGDQWSDEDKARLTEQMRVPIVFNRVAPVADSVAGLEVGNRQEIHYYPQQVGSSGKADLLSAAAKFFRAEADTEDEESDAFYDCLVCGLGVTEIRPDYESDPEGSLPTDRLDPLSVFYDPSARKRNLVDRRYCGYVEEMPITEARALFPDAEDEDLHASWATVTDTERDPHDADPLTAYNKGDELTAGGNVARRKVTVVYIEWWDREQRMMVVDPLSGKRAEFSKEKHAKAKKRLAALGIDLPGVEVTRKVFKSAFLGAKVLKSGPGRVDDEFTVNFITGKRDRNKNTWYGIVRAMIDPQRWANKFFSQIHHIISSNAKGGLMVEKTAVDNPRQFEESWADPSGITWLQDGAVTKGQVREKPAITYPGGLDKMMEYAVSAIRDTTGVNLELLGMADREQAGILEAQRKQAGMTILSVLFDSLRRYRKIQGRVLLGMIQKYVPEGRLIRIDQSGGPQYAKFVKDAAGTRYDIIVDEAPTSTNAKERAWIMITQLMPMMQHLPLPPDAWLEILKYSPLPDTLMEKIQQMMQQAAQHGPPPDPKMVKVQQDGQVAKAKLQLEQAATMADIEVARSTALVNLAKAGATSGGLQIDQANALVDAISGQQQQAHDQALARAQTVHQQAMDHAQTAHDQALAQQQQAHDQQLAQAQFAHQQDMAQQAQDLKAQQAAQPQGE
jgi:hypothetical protein